MIIEKRKGISTFIATLLLMVLAVSAGVVIYAYTMGYLGGFGNPQAMGALSLDSAKVSEADGLTVYVRNIGHTSIVFDSLYVDGVRHQVADLTITYPDDGEALGENAVAEILFDGSFTEAQTYQFKIVAKDNTQISFGLKAVA
jgi:FlaG/FlaF family flagellin (archaellin)